jgi:hypothetical protein
MRAFSLFFRLRALMLPLQNLTGFWTKTDSLARFHQHCVQCGNSFCCAIVVRSMPRSDLTLSAPRSYVDRNQLTGTIPPEILQIGELRSLYAMITSDLSVHNLPHRTFEKNRLFGPLPTYQSFWEIWWVVFVVLLGKPSDPFFSQFQENDALETNCLVRETPEFNNQ